MRKLAPAALEAKDFSRDWFVERLRPLEDIDFSNEAFQQAPARSVRRIGVSYFTESILSNPFRMIRRTEIEKIIEGAQPVTGNMDNVCFGLRSIVSPASLDMSTNDVESVLYADGINPILAAAINISLILKWLRDLLCLGSIL